MTSEVPELLRLSDADDLEAALVECHRVDAAAFGLPANPAQRDAKRAMVEPDRWYLASIDGVACGGVGAFPTEVTLPGPVTVPASAVSDVGVLPSHRRRGVASALLRRQLDDIADGGEPLAVLHASEGSIYRRFGYGPATRWRLAVIDARRTTFRDDMPLAGGSLDVVDATAAAGICPDVHDRVRLGRVGGLARNDAWWSVVTGSTECYLGGDPRHLYLAHFDDDGRADGYAIYSVAEDWSRGQANHSLDVWELVGESVAVELALWRALIEHDLVATVTGPIAIDHALWDVVADARQVGLRWDQDLLWARVLDVPAVLAARRYASAGSAVISVEDPFLGRCTGTWRLDVDASGAATCTADDGPGDVLVDVADLGSLLLGGTSMRRLQRAGRIAESTPGTVACLDAMAQVDPLPWCWVRF